jgi:hypothetical protein
VRGTRRLDKAGRASTDALAVVPICFGLSIMRSGDAVLTGFGSAGFTDDGAFALVLTEPALSATALLVPRSHG